MSFSHNRRIIFCNRYFYPDHSATSQMLSDLAFALADGKLDVHVVTSRQRYDDPSAELLAREKVAGVEVHRVPTTRFGRGRLVGRAVDYFSFYGAAIFALWRLLRPGDVLVAKTDPPLISVPAAWVAKWRGGHLVNWLQDLFPEVAIALGVRGFHGVLGRGLVRVRNGSLRQAAANVAIGERMREKLQGLGVPGEDIQVIHNWADGERIRPVAPDRNPLRAEWGLQDRFIVGYSGNLGRAHEFETLLEAARRLNGREDIVFLFIGDGPRRTEVEAAVQAQGLANVQFRPYQPREWLAESLSLPDLHLISLRPELEGFIVPSKFYGVAAAGRPTLFVGDTEGEIAQLLEEGDCGYAIPTGDGAGLASHIEALAADRKRCDEMGVNSRRFFEQRFDHPIAMRQWCEILGVAQGIEAEESGEEVASSSPSR
ncbi:glycosyltransferase WbuB [Nitrosococcus wardiae]|uniref:Glycosyltransferase WbuB n=2 Tax=Nitrosococcus wardiae TaxID=1814290 RepID=A0A4P7C6C5_9GAMM|nr:glycosyltransferase WbuB [Nitrosococcus wardiae]